MVFFLLIFIDGKFFEELFLECKHIYSIFLESGLEEYWRAVFGEILLKIKKGEMHFMNDLKSSRGKHMLLDTTPFSSFSALKDLKDFADWINRKKLSYLEVHYSILLENNKKKKI